VLAHPTVDADPRGLFQRALAVDRAQGPAAAAPLYEQVADAGYAEALLNLGLVHRRLGDHSAELECYAEALQRGVPASLTGVLAGQALALRGRPRRALETLVDTRDAASGLTGTLAASVCDARAIQLLADALVQRPGDPDLTHNLAFAYLFADRARDGLELLADVPPAGTGADWLLRAALTEATHGRPEARAVIHEARLTGVRTRPERFLLHVAEGNVSAPEDALRAYLAAAALCERPPRYLLTNLGRLLAGPRDTLETLRALARIAGHDTAALATAARAAAGAPAIDNRALLWLLRAEVGLKFPVHWLLPW
jgi:tetratricopeptide (TPR) repeat protein